MLERDHSGAAKILTDSPLEDFPRAGEGAKAFFQGRTARARDDSAAARRYFAAAAYSFARQVRANPNDASSHAAMGLLYAYMEEKEDALRESYRAVELEPESQNASMAPRWRPTAH